MASTKDRIKPAPSSSATAGFNEPSYGGYDHSVSIQMLLEVQKTLVRIDCRLDALEVTVAATNTILTSTKAEVKDLVKWKHLITGGAIVAAIALSAAGYLAKGAFDSLALTIKTEIVKTK